MKTLTVPAEETRYVELQQMALDVSRHGETDTLAAMLDAGMPANLSDAKGNSLLMLASYNGHVETARLLLARGADADRRNDRGQTPLGGAAFKGDAEMTGLLLAHGADIEADNGGGMTPIMFAAMFGRTEVVNLLEREGASLRWRSRFGVSAKFLVRASRGMAALLQGFRKPAGGFR
jgi:uncharacterized protein